jgi:hypothetical protein
MDRFINFQHAVCTVTKIILRDKWGEWPNVNVDEIRQLGGAPVKVMRRDSLGGATTHRWARMAPMEEWNG